MHRLGPGLERHQADITYWVLPEHRGQGWGRRIAAHILGLAAAHPGTREVILRIAPDNPASARIARSLGAAPTGILERHPADAARIVERWAVPEDRV